MGPRGPSAPAPTIMPMETECEAQACARLMASSEPWMSLGRGYDASLRVVQDSSQEVYLAREAGEIVGFVIVCMTGAFVGYIQAICIHPGRRGRGLGSRLVAFAEARILRESPNIFMCV